MRDERVFLHLFFFKLDLCEIGHVCSVILNSIVIWNLVCKFKMTIFCNGTLCITLDHSQWSWFVCPPSSPLLDWQVLCWFHTKIALWSIRFFNLLLLLFRCHIYSYYEIRWFKHCKYLFRWSWDLKNYLYIFWIFNTTYFSPRFL